MARAVQPMAMAGDFSVGLVNMTCNLRALATGPVFTGPILRQNAPFEMSNFEISVVNVELHPDYNNLQCFFHKITIKSDQKVIGISLIYTCSYRRNNKIMGR